MRFYSLGQLSNNEKSDILGKHREIYNGYKQVVPPVSNTQPLYTQDFANDKIGITVNGSGEVSGYSNKIYMKESKEVCSECGGGMREGECMECGREYMEEMGEQEINPYYESEMNENKGMCSECGGTMMEGECSECGWKGGMEEGIYDFEDLNPKNEFDYTKEEEMDEDHMDRYEPMTSAFDEELDEEISPSPLYSEVDPAYDFKSNGPMYADGPYGGMRENEMEEGFYDTNDYIDFTDYSDNAKDLTDYGERDTAMSRMRRGKGDVEDIDWEEGDDKETAFSKIKKGRGDIEDIDFEEVDEDIMESFIIQKTKINEMFNRMSRYN